MVNRVDVLMKIMNIDIELLPMRSLDDFLLRSARFQLPNYNDWEKWGNRVAQNLLYYQTNYLAMVFITILVVCLFQPLKMICGVLSVISMCASFNYYFNATSSGTAFKDNHPSLALVIVFAGACSIFYLLGSLLMFAFSILLPLSMVFIHASLRLRNIKNKLSNIERMVSKQTPMGVLLEMLGMEPDFIS